MFRSVPRFGLLALTLTAPAPPAANAAEIAAGRRIARDQCAECHAIGRTDRSRRPAATPFRQIPSRYPVEALEEAFGEGITGSHKGMPDFQLSPRDIDDLLAYIGSLASARR